MLLHVTKRRRAPSTPFAATRREHEQLALGAARILSAASTKMMHTNSLAVVAVLMCGVILMITRAKADAAQGANGGCPDGGCTTNATGQAACGTGHVMGKSGECQRADCAVVYASRGAEACKAMKFEW